MLWLIKRKILKWGQRALVLSIMVATYRPMRRAFLYGGNDLEENLLVTALALSECYQGRIVVMADDPAVSERALRVVAEVLDSDPSRVDVRKSTLLGGICLFASSELVFSTHFRFSGPA